MKTDFLIKQSYDYSGLYNILAILFASGYHKTTSVLLVYIANFWL